MSDADEIERERLRAVERLRLRELIRRAVEEQAKAHAALGLKGAGLSNFLDAQNELEDLRAELESFEAEIEGRKGQ